MQDSFVHVTGGECYFSINLRRMRLLREPRLSQERLARKLGVCRATYAKYEQGRRMPPAWFVFSTADYFGVAVEEMFYKPNGVRRYPQKGGNTESQSLEEATKFKVGDRVEATWASGRTSIHTITGIRLNAPHGTLYKFLDEDGYEVSLYENFLSACHS